MNNITGCIMITIGGRGFLQTVVDTFVDATGGNMHWGVILIVKNVIIVIVILWVLEHTVCCVYTPGPRVHHGGGTLAVHAVTGVSIHFFDLMKDECCSNDDDKSENGHNYHGDYVDTVGQLMVADHLKW